MKGREDEGCHRGCAGPLGPMGAALPALTTPSLWEQLGAGNNPCRKLARSRASFLIHTNRTREEWRAPLPAQIEQKRPRSDARRMAFIRHTANRRGTPIRSDSRARWRSTFPGWADFAGEYAFIAV